jgi:hypothetical protein
MIGPSDFFAAPSCATPPSSNILARNNHLRIMMTVIVSEAASENEQDADKLAEREVTRTQPRWRLNAMQGL